MDLSPRPFDALSGRKLKRVLLVFCPVLDESSHKFAKGVAQYLVDHEPWETYLDNKGLSLTGAKWIEGQHWDGVISRHTNQFQVDIFARLKVPLVDLHNAHPFSGVSHVALDNVAVGAAGAAHMIERGFFNTAFCGFSNERWSTDRRRGFRSALSAAGRSCLLFETKYPGADTPDWDTKEISAMSEWLTSAPRPLAVMACNDFRALQLMHAVEAAGLSVPEDVAILGANDDEVRCELAHPQLSSVPANHVEAGYRAAKLLDEYMSGRPYDGRSLSVGPLPAITRGSTDIIAVQDKRIAAALRYIHEHGCTAITVSDVCRHAGIARTQLEQRFREIFARSPQAEIRRVRLNRVQQLLHDTDLPLRTIAEMSGFEHVEYLSVFFKKAMGQTPGRYRRGLLKGIQTHS